MMFKKFLTVDLARSLRFPQTRKQWALVTLLNDKKQENGRSQAAIEPLSPFYPHRHYHERRSHLCPRSFIGF